MKEIDNHQTFVYEPNLCDGTGALSRLQNWRRIHRASIALATGLFIATVWLANYSIHHWGTAVAPGNVHTVPVWFGLTAPSGVLFVGLAFVLRDYIQYQASRWLALAAILVGTVLSYFVVSHTLAEASAAGFVASEVIGLLAFWAWQRKSVVGAVLIAGAIAAALDSLIFLWIAFGSLAFFQGQFVAKVTMSLLAVPLVLGTRRLVPRPA